MKIINVLNIASEVAEEGMSWHPEESLEVLPKAGVGMLVIFAIISVIIITTAVLGKITSNKDK